MKVEVDYTNKVDESNEINNNKEETIEVTSSNSPVASFTITPSLGNILTDYQFDASSSYDNEDSTSELEVRWDWENDGVWDTGYTTEKVISHVFNSIGEYTIKLELKDTDGLINTTKRVLNVEELKSKIGVAILVVGTIPNDPILLQSIESTNHMYNTLLKRGYVKDDIYYLCPDTTLDADGNGLMDDVDAESNWTNLLYAITTWAVTKSDSDTPFLLYLTDHGGPTDFVLSESDRLNPITLHSWINDYKTNTGASDITIIVSSCFSGIFLPELADTNHIIITKSTSDLYAYDGFDIPFSEKIREGKSISEAFNYAKDEYLNLLLIFGSYVRFPPQPIGSPQIDDNGNGIPNEEEDGELAINRYIGLSLQDIIIAPTINLFTDDNKVNIGESILINSSVIDDIHVESVWAEIIPPGLIYSENPLEFNLPVVYLNRVNNSHYYSGTYTPNEIGLHSIIIYALDNDGNFASSIIITLNVTNLPSINNDDDDSPGFEISTILFIIIVVFFNKRRRFNKNNIIKK